jgi:glycosyltransferase involved in cell wall biosynthesis
LPVSALREREKQMAEKPMVSVVIPVHNGAHYIATAVRSALVQTQPAAEVIVVDDGSEDDLDKELAPFAGKIKLLHQERKGVSAARNNGIQHAQGEWIAFLDHDDEWLPNKLEKQLPLAGRPEVGIIYCDLEVFGEYAKPSWFAEREMPRGKIIRDLLARNFIFPSTALVRRQALVEAGGFDESITHLQDWDMWLRLAERWEAASVPEPLILYRVHDSMASKNEERVLINRINVLQKTKSYAPEDYRAMWPEFRERIGLAAFSLGRLYLHRGDSRQARARFAQAAGIAGYRLRGLVYWLTTFLPANSRAAIRKIKQSHSGSATIAALTTVLLSLSDLGVAG